MFRRWWPASGRSVRLRSAREVHLASFAPPVVHRDIKPANVLLEVNSSEPWLPTE